jgi:hypothetical protein
VSVFADGRIMTKATAVTALTSGGQPLTLYLRPHLPDEAR